MLLALDVGNSQIFGGLFAGEEILFRFRHDSRITTTSDQLGVFLKTLLREHQIDSGDIKKIAICSVVPNIDYSLRAACKKYFAIEPFLLKVGTKTGLQIQYRNPQEVGADRIANAIAISHLFPKQNVIIADFGTATTFCVISKNKQYQGGVILAGMRLSMEALQSKAAKLFPVEIVAPEHILGKSTAESIQSGLYYGQLAIVKEISQRIQQEIFTNDSYLLIGTGGFAHLFEKEGIFTAIIPDLVLHGLRFAIALNQ